MCNVSIHHWMWEAYRESIRNHFRNHPDVDTIMERLENDESVSIEDLDKWFAEADRYSHEKLAKCTTPNRLGRPE